MEVQNWGKMGKGLLDCHQNLIDLSLCHAAPKTETAVNLVKPNWTKNRSFLQTRDPKPNRSQFLLTAHPYFTSASGHPTDVPFLGDFAEGCTVFQLSTSESVLISNGHTWMGTQSRHLARGGTLLNRPIIFQTPLARWCHHRLRTSRSPICSGIIIHCTFSSVPILICLFYLLLIIVLSFWHNLFKA